jgi:hypothetical protein
MTRLITACCVLTLAIAVAACADSSPSGALSAGYFKDAGAPLIAPYSAGAVSEGTTQKQEKSGYFPTADAPLVGRDDVTINPDATALKQLESGYFPTAGAPLVSLTTTGIR